MILKCKIIIFERILETNMSQTDIMLNNPSSETQHGHGCNFYTTSVDEHLYLRVVPCRGILSEGIMVVLEADTVVKAVSVDESKIFFVSETDIFVIDALSGCPKKSIYSGDFSGKVVFYSTCHDFIVVSNDDTLSCISRNDVDCFVLISQMAMTPENRLNGFRSFIYSSALFKIGIVWNLNCLGGKFTFVEFYDDMTMELVSRMHFPRFETICVDDCGKCLTLTDGSRIEIPV